MLLLTTNSLHFEFSLCFFFSNLKYFCEVLQHLWGFRGSREIKVRKIMVRIRRKVSIIKLFSSKGEIEAFKKL